MRKTFLIAAAFLAGCANPPKPVYTATGAIGQALDCSGLARTWADCELQAGAICKAAGYDVVSQKQEDHSKALIDHERTISDIAGATRIARTMTIRCKN